MAGLERTHRQRTIEEPPGEEDVLWVSAMPQVFGAVEKKLRRYHMKVMVFRLLPSIGRVIACVILAFFVCLTAAVAVVKPVRARVLEILENVDGKLSRSSLQERRIEFLMIPAGPEAMQRSFHLLDSQEHCLGHCLPRTHRLAFRDAAEKRGSMEGFRMLSRGRRWAERLGTKGFVPLARARKRI